MPRPKPKESEKDFVQRYVNSKEAKKTFPQTDQRVAVAHDLWKKRHGKK
jgi:hypothetical protein